MDEETKALNVILSRINGLYHRWNLGIGVTDIRTQILIALASEKELSQKTICLNYLLPKQTVSKEIIEMQSEGLVAMKQSDEDHRSKVICMTEAGERYAEEVLKPYFELSESIWRRMGEERSNMLLTGLKDYAAALESEINMQQK